MDADERRQAIADKLAKHQPKAPRPFVDPKPFKAKPKPEIAPPAFTPTKWTGRPTKYIAEQHCIDAVEQMAMGHSLTGLAGYLLVAKETVYRWAEEHSEFRDAIKIGRAARVRFLENKLLKTSIGVGVTAAIFALKNADPDEYRDIITNDHNVNVRIDKVSDAQLLEIIGRSAPRVLEHRAAGEDVAQPRTTEHASDLAPR